MDRVPPDIVRVKAINLKTKEEITLKTTQERFQSDGRCHWFDDFTFNDQFIRLRLDWGDPDGNNDPTLKANFFEYDTEQEDKL